MPIKHTESDKRTEAIFAVRSVAAKKAWVTRESAPYRARRTAVNSQRALEKWAAANTWRVIFLDAASGFPRTGIIDAILVRVRPREPDSLDVLLVQLKAGSAGLKATELKRLRSAATKLRARHVAAFFDGGALYFEPDPPK